MDKSGFGPNDNKAGLYLSAPECKTVGFNTLSLVINGNNTLSLRRGNKNIEGKSFNLQKDITEIKLMVVKQGNEYKIFADGAKEPQIAYTADTANGGTVIMYSEKCVTKFNDFKINELYQNTKLDQTPIYKKWMK